MRRFFPSFAVKVQVSDEWEVDFSDSISIKLTSLQWHCLEIELHSYWSISMTSMEKNFPLHAWVNYGCPGANFHRIHICSKTFVKSPSTEFYENPANCLIAGNTSRMA
jgi:hypothetical protein